VAVCLGISSVMPESGILMPAVNPPNVVGRDVIAVVLVSKVSDFGLAVKGPGC